jgi:formate transporter
MDYVKPADVAKAMAETGSRKLALSIPDLLIRGILSGAILGVATSLAFNASFTTGQPLVGALIFPVGFVMIVLLGLELVTGNFALLPLAVRERRVTFSALAANWTWVFLGNLLGSVFYAALFTLTVTPDSEMARLLVTVAETKTLGYAKLGNWGLVVAVSKAILCNWMVTLGVVMALTSQSTIGKIAAMWLPILTFFAQGFEHSVVNMFAIPAGMLLGARVSMADWWLWNQIPVTIGNLIAGVVLTGFALYATHRKRAPRAVSPVAVPALSLEAGG